MGLLSNPKTRKKIIDSISKYNNPLCALCYIVGAVWFISLAYQPLNAKTYFSENALLPGVVDSGFFFDFDAHAMVQELKEELKKEKRQVPRNWVFDRFQELGLETYIQNYSITYPLNIIRGQQVPGQNVYAILRARRAASTEAIVLSVPFRAKSSDLPQSYGGIVMMIGLAKYFSRQPYWSKDIIFLVSDHEQIGMQAWLNGYHFIPSPYIKSGEMGGRSGSIQAALNLEIPEGNIKYFNIKIEGINGQLPNLDLVNLVVRLTKKHGVEIMLHNSRDSSDMTAESLAGFQHSASTMIKMMWAQASGLPTGNHGLFHRYHIEAVTLEGIRKKKTGHTSLQTTAKIVEGICRSLNNLLERFHQSFFFYILPSTERYVSIGLYMIPFAIMCSSGLIKAVALWVGQYKEGEEDEGKKKLVDDKDKDASAVSPDKEGEGAGVKQEVKKEAKTSAKTTKAKQEKISKEKLDGLVEEEGEDNFDEDHPKGVLSILPLVICSVLMALLCYSGPEFLADMAVPFKMNIQDGIFYGFLALFTASLLFPRMIARKTSDKKKLAFDWVLLKAIVLIYQSLAFFALSLMNISLAYFLALLILPSSLIVTPSKNWFRRWGQRFLLLVISPLSLLYTAALVANLDQNYSSILELLLNSWATLSQGLLLSLVDSYFFGSWFFSLFSFTVLPNWLALWGISFCEAS